MLRVTFVTEGDPSRISGGSLYHRRLAELAPTQDATVRFVSVPSRPFPLGALAGRRVLREAFDGADVVVVDSLASNTLGPWLAAMRSALRRRLPPLVVSVHQVLGGSDDDRWWVRTLRARSDRMAYAVARRMVVPSELLAGQLVAAGIARATLTVVPPGRDVPAAATSPVRLDLRATHGAALLCVANWIPRKGITELLEAVAAVPPGADVVLHLVGDETVDRDYARQVLDRLARPDLAGRVVRHGVVAPEGVGPFYDAADVFVLPSTEEPFGMVYAEAMSAGLPIVGWAAGNLPFLVDDGVEGVVAPTGDLAQLTGALWRLATDEALRDQLGKAAAVRADAMPTWDETAERFFAVCRLALDVSRSSPRASGRPSSDQQPGGTA